MADEKDVEYVLLETISIELTKIFVKRRQTVTFDLYYYGKWILDIRIDYGYGGIWTTHLQIANSILEMTNNTEFTPMVIDDPETTLEKILSIAERVLLHKPLPTLYNGDPEISGGG